MYENLRTTSKKGGSTPCAEHVLTLYLGALWRSGFLLCWLCITVVCATRSVSSPDRTGWPTVSVARLYAFHGSPPAEILESVDHLLDMSIVDVVPSFTSHAHCNREKAKQKAPLVTEHEKKRLGLTKLNRRLGCPDVVARLGHLVDGDVEEGIGPPYSG